MVPPIRQQQARTKSQVKKMAVCPKPATVARWGWPTVAALLLLPVLIPNSLLQAQCPWTRESVELHSDCICDFNPSLTTNLERQDLPPINRMSVQCAPVDFASLLVALKQTASIELPPELVWSDQPMKPLNGSTSSKSKHRDEQGREAAAQFVSQSKIDLLHLSNSTIGRLEQDTFVLDLASLQRQSDGSSVQLNHQNSSAKANGDLAAADAGERRVLLVVAMQSLHLSRCQIDWIHEDAFKGLEWSLTSLSLSDNLLEHVPSAALKPLVNLKVLDLSNNKLAQVEASAFLTLNKLNTLRLADNRLACSAAAAQARSSSSPASSLAANSSQQAAAAAAWPKSGGMQTNSRIQTNEQDSFSSNTKAGIDRAAFAGLENCLTDLNLKNTQLVELPEAARHLRRLAFLNLAQNQISYLAPRSFQLSQSLTAINLERNRIARLHEDTFAGVERSLSSLSLLGNLLAEFPAGQLAKLANLRRLDIGFNEIEQIPQDAFLAHPRLMLIALDGNPIESLPELTFKPLEGILKGMSVGGKALNCDCRLSWMLRWQREHSLQISSREREPQFCARPHYLRSLISFAALKPEHLTCESWPATTPFAFLQSQSWVSDSNRQQLANSTSPKFVPERQTTKPVVELPATATPALATTGYIRSSATDPTTTAASSDLAETVMDGDESTIRNEFAAAGTTPMAPSSESGGRQTNGASNKSRAASLPDDELFVSEPNSIDRKTNRHGFQANKHGERSSQSVLDSVDLVRSTPNGSPPRAASGPESQRPRAEQVTSAPKTRAQQQVSPHGGSIVFGARNNATLNGLSEVQQMRRQETRRATSHLANQTGALVPAIPTTVNVYKQLLNFNSQQQAVLLKGPRLMMDEQQQLQPPTTNQQQTSAQPTAAAPAFATPKLTTSSYAGADLDIERYSAQPSQVEPILQPQQPQTHTGRAASVPTATTQVPQANAGQFVTNWRSEQTDSSSSALDEADREFGARDLTAESPPRKPEAGERNGAAATTTMPTMTTTTNRPFSNNTRMSVSSMYRLSTTPRQQHQQLADTTQLAATPTQMDHQRGPSSPRLIEAGSRLIQTTSSSTTTTTTSTTSTTTTPAPATLVREQQASASEAPAGESRAQIVSTTRMAATVRFVDSSPTSWPQTIRQQQQQSSSSSSPASSSTSPTPSINSYSAQTPKYSLAPSANPRQPISTNQRPSQARHDQPVAAKPLEIRPNTTHTTMALPSTNGPSATRADDTEQSGDQELRSVNSDRNLVALSQHPKLESSAGSFTEMRPSQPASTTTRIPKSSSQSRQQQNGASLITKDSFNFVPRQAREEAHNSSAFQRHLDGSAQFFWKVFRFVDVDQLALILAGILCLFIFLLAMTTICLCCCRHGRPSSGSGGGGSSSSRFHQPESRRANVGSSPGRKATSPMLARFLCCCFGGGRKAVTPMRSLILQDDDSSSGGCSSGSTTIGGAKSANINPADSLFLRRQTTQKDEVNLLRSIRRASMRLANDFRSLHHQPTRLINTMGNRKTAANRERQQQQQFFQAAGQLDKLPGAGDRWRVCVLPADDASSSCDSDKSCSPGANRNNRYNIGEAHRAYLSSEAASQQQQIRASRFLMTTSDGGQLGGEQAKQPNGAHSRAGLLKTIESQQQQGSLPAVDYFDAYSGMSSDKSTTDDSGAPLSFSCRPSSFGLNRTTFSPFKAQGRRQQQAAGLEAASAIFEAHRQQQQQDELLASADLVPMSAEEQWPEPYVEPEDLRQAEEAAAEDERHRAEVEETQSRANNERHSFVQFEPSAAATANEFNLNQRSHTTSLSKPKRRHHHHPAQSQPQQPIAAYDDAYLYTTNWHTTSRNPRRAHFHDTHHHQLAQQPALDDTGQPQGATVAALIRHRSIPSLQPGSSFLAWNQPAAGASSWLRWTPASFVGQTNSFHRNPRSNRHQQTTDDSGWSGDNHIESIQFVANKQQR